MADRDRGAHDARIKSGSDLRGSIWLTDDRATNEAECVQDSGEDLHGCNPREKWILKSTLQKSLKLSSLPR